MRTVIIWYNTGNSRQYRRLDWIGDIAISDSNAIFALLDGGAAPARRVLSADGLPIARGQLIYDADGNEYIVMETTEHFVGCGTIMLSGDDGFSYLSPSELYHIAPTNE